MRRIRPVSLRDLAVLRITAIGRLRVGWTLSAFSMRHHLAPEAVDGAATRAAARMSSTQSSGMFIFTHA
jgi:hypothetical protein